jgi:RNA polymerase sigma-70 factor (ECF subfamily)
MVMLTAHQSVQGTYEVFSAAVEEQLCLPATTTGEQVQTAQSHQNGALAHALQGSHEAFASIVDAYSTSMLRTAIAIVGDRDTAEDIVQDSFIQAWHHLSDLRQAEALRSWLMRIVVNQCISFKRRLARSLAFTRQALSEQETDLMARVADDYKGCMERNWDLARAVAALPIKQRVVIVLHYYNNMTLHEISQSLNISENTLKKRIQTALNNLRRTLRFNEEPEPGYISSAA